MKTITIQFVGHDTFLMDLCCHYVAQNSTMKVLNCINPQELNSLTTKNIDILFIDLPAENQLIYQYGIMIKRILPNCRTYALGHRKDFNSILKLQHIGKLFYELIPRSSTRYVLNKLVDSVSREFNMKQTNMEYIKFTKREQQIIALVYRELSNNAIASELSISLRTVETHKSNIYLKLGTKNPTSVIKYAVHFGIT